MTDIPQPALATLSHERFWEDGWVYERKLDGQRCLAVRTAQGGPTVAPAAVVSVTERSLASGDGRVEVLAHGSRAAVETFVAWLWTGSTASKVTSVEAAPLDCEADQLPPDFTTG